MDTSRNTGIRSLEPDDEDALSTYVNNITNTPSAPNTSVRDSLAAQLRAQYNTGAGGSGSWDDAGYDRAAELADLLINAGVTSLGDLRLVDTPYQSEGGIPLQDKYPGAQQVSVLRSSGDSEYYDSVWVDANGVPIDGVLYDDNSMPYISGMVDTTGRQLMIGDKAVGYLGDYNNDGTFGSKSSEYFGPGKPNENLLAWSARGSGNTSYRVITDPATGKLVITPGWNSSSDAADFRKAGIFLGGAALGGGGISGSLAGAAGLTGGAGAALSGAATGAGLNMATTQDISEDTAIAAALGGIGGYLGHTGGDLLKTLTPGGADSLIGGGTDAILDAAGNTVPLNMAAIESGLGTPGYGFNASAAASNMFDPSVIGSGAGLMYGPGGTIIPYDPAAVSAMTANDAVTKPKLDLKNTDNWTEEQWNEFLKESGDVPYDTPVTSETVDVTAQRIPPVNAGGAVGAGIGATLPDYGNEGNNYPPSTNNPDYGNEGRNYPTPESTQGPGGSPVNAGPTPDWGNSIKDWILKNPKLAATLAGSLLGKAGGNNTPAPPSPGTGPQAGFTATPAPSLGRQYVAPPPGYRPGFDPEHRYFTGIGMVGTGG